MCPTLPRFGGTRYRPLRPIPDPAFGDVPAPGVGDGRVLAFLIVRDSVLKLADGRDLALVELGAGSDPPVMYFHGVPTSRLDLVSRESEIRAARARVIAVDRPGFGGSSPQPWRHLNDWARDVDALADHLALDRFAVLGLSAGGAFATASATLLPNRVGALGLVAAVSDPAWEGSRARETSEEEALYATDDEDAVRAWHEERFGADGSGYLAGATELPAPDAAVFDDPVHGPALLGSVSESFRQGVGGMAQDRLVRSRPWTFDPASVDVPTAILHGEQDTVVTIENGEHNMTLLPTARLTRFPEHGHISIMSEIPKLAGDLATALGS